MDGLWAASLEQAAQSSDAVVGLIIVSNALSSSWDPLLHKNGSKHLERILNPNLVFDFGGLGTDAPPPLPLLCSSWWI